MRPSFHGPFRAPMLPFPLGLALEGYTLINYPIPPERLNGLLPSLFEPATTFLNGRPVAWLSIFVGRNRLRSVGLLPALPLAFPQLNYRTYVKHATGHGLYVFRSVIGAEPFATGARLSLRFPAEFRPFAFRPTLVGGRLERVEARVGIGGHELDVQVEAVQAPPDMRGFADFDEAVAFLGNVPEAAFPIGGGEYGTLLSPHPPLRPQAGRLIRGRLTWPLDRGLLTPEEVIRPDSVFLQAVADFPTRM